MLKGFESLRFWDEEVERDLVTLTKKEKEKNPLSAWFTPKLVSTYDFVFQPISLPSEQ